jgi:OFA family oxalate/formate antiporter-like MFS transporter
MQRWVVLVAGVVLQTILGGIYAWSAFVPALMERYGLTNGQCGLVFGTAIAVFTLSMILAGRALQAYGPRITAGTGAILFAAGYVTASFSGGSFPLIFVGIAVLVGAGIGAGYVCPLTVAMAWFPRHRGLITGVAVAGFGGGAVFLGALADYLLHGPEWDVLSVFRFVGVGFGAVAFVAALLLSEPGGRTDGSTQSRPAPRGGLVSHLFSREFGLLCLGMFAGTFAGLLSVGNLKPLILNAGLGVRVATAGISVFACGNAVGRVFWGQVHDRLGSRTTILLSQATLGLALIPLAFRLGPGAMLGAVTLCGFGFGACFVVYASSVVDRFGLDLFPRLYPICFLWYGLAGITGPGTGGWIADTSGGFAPAVFLSVGLVWLAFLITLLVFPRKVAS